MRKKYRYKFKHNKKEIKIFMIRKGLSNRDIAQELGVTEQAISNFIAGKSKSNRIREFLGMMGCPDNVFCKKAYVNV